MTATYALVHFTTNAHLTDGVPDEHDAALNLRNVKAANGTDNRLK